MKFEAHREKGLKRMLKALPKLRKVDCDNKFEVLAAKIIVEMRIASNLQLFKDSKRLLNSDIPEAHSFFESLNER